jgi:hypothetical protein
MLTEKEVGQALARAGERIDAVFLELNGELYARLVHEGVPLDELRMRLLAHFRALQSSRPRLMAQLEPQIRYLRPDDRTEH